MRASLQLNDTIALSVASYLAHWHTKSRNIKDVSKKELYNFESLYKFIQRACTVFWTVTM
jgi:hypothetical protein